MGLGAQHSKSTVLCGCAKANSVLGGRNRERDDGEAQCDGGGMLQHWDPSAALFPPCGWGQPQHPAVLPQQSGTWGCLRALLLAFPHSHSLAGILGEVCDIAVLAEAVQTVSLLFLLVPGLHCWEVSSVCFGKGKMERGSKPVFPFFPHL